MLLVLQITLLYLFFAALIYFITRRKTISISGSQVFLAFGFLVLLGCIHGYIYSTYYPTDDTVLFNKEAFEQFHKLKTNPGEFFSEISLADSFRRNDSFSVGWHYLLDDLQKWMIIKPLAIFNFISNGNYYLNVVFFCFLIFWGPYLLFKLFTSIQPSWKEIFFVAAFLIPSIAFWTASIRSDGFIVVSLGIILYYFNAWLDTKKWWQLVSAFIGCIGLIILRDELLLLLIPALLAWWLINQYNFKPWKVFAVVYGVIIILFFSTPFPAMVANRQHEFLQLHGTAFKLDPLSPTVGSFLSIFPQAVLNAFVRPFPWEAQGVLQWAMVADILLLISLLILALINRKHILAHPQTWLVFAYSFTTIIFIGFTVPFPGAIVRYKAIPELLLYIILVSSIPLKNKYM